MAVHRKGTGTSNQIIIVAVNCMCFNWLYDSTGVHMNMHQSKIQFVKETV